MTDDKIIQKIKREYIAGKGSQRSLAEKYGVSAKRIERIAGRERWGELRGKAGEKAGEKIAEQVATQSAKVDEEFFSLVDQLVALTGAAMDRTARSGNLSPAAVEHYANTVATIQKIKGIKSALDTEEQKAKIDKLRKDIESADNDQTGGIVIDLGGAASWAK